MDSDKSHQADEFKLVWRQVNPSIIIECKFQHLINKNEQLKMYVFNLFQIYHDGKLFDIDKLIKDDTLAL